MMATFDIIDVDWDQEEESVDPTEWERLAPGVFWRLPAFQEYEDSWQATGSSVIRA